jgi:hypothetical protein
MKKNEGTMKKVTSFLWVGFLMVAMLILPLQANAETTGVVISVAKDATIKSSDIGSKSVGNVSGLSKNCNVTVTTSNKDVVALVEYEKEVDSVTIIGEEQDLDKKGKWSTYTEDFANGLCEYVAMGAGEAVITVTVTDTSDATAEPLAKSFTVYVTKSTPELAIAGGENLKNLKTVAMWRDRELNFRISNVSRNATLTIKCNKNNVFTHYYKKSKKWNVKKSGTVYTPNLGAWGDVTLMAKKAGKFKLTLVLTQDGTTYTYPLTVTVKKYVNPISNLTINNKNYAKRFNKYSYIGRSGYGRGKEIIFYNSKQQTYTCSLTLKKGYSLEEVYWSGEKLNTTKSNGKYSFTINIKENYVKYLEFVLKDKQGNRLTMWSFGKIQ